MGGDESKLSMPSGVKAMGQALQRKFARGVQYNMKIVIKGDRNTGKTCILHRLQGRPFSDQYIPTNEIQVCKYAGSIHWSYKATDDIVKVDVWDVVDVGKSRKSSDSLKIENDAPNSPEDEDSVVADANFVDVYKGTHGVIMVMDITKPWTFQYLRKELPKVPAHIPVLVLGNHRDMEEHRLIVPEDVTSFIQTLERPDRSPPIHYAESSMKNGFGLKYIHTFLNFPFLLLQRETLLQQLQVNAMDMESTLEELQIYKHTEEQDYDQYLDFLDKRKRERDAKVAAEAAKAVEAAPKTAGETTSPGSSSPPITAADREVISKTKSPPNSPPSNIEEFRPEDELDAGFLNEGATAAGKSKSKTKPKPKPVKLEKTPSDSSDESDSDSDPKNPMVSKFTEDISDEDETYPTKTVVVNGNLDSEHSDEPRVKPRKVVEDIHITSSEEEEEPEIRVQPIPQVTPDSKPKKGLKIDVNGSAKANRKQNDMASRKAGGDVFDDWLESPGLESPGLEPKYVPFNPPSEKGYSVRKVDVNSPIETSPPPASIGVDEWSLFMEEQMSVSQKKSKKPDLLDDDDDDDDEEPAKENKHHKKSGEKSRSKKHKKHKEKPDEEEGDKERRKHKHKHKDSEKERKPKDEESEKTKR
ncbi:hypothetical protein QZH41_015043, partial [Actinostola sp. cb2023]